MMLISLILRRSSGLQGSGESGETPPGRSEHFKAGMVALSSEQFEKAEVEFKRATVIDPLYDAAFYGLGQVYMATRRYEQALRAYLDSRKAFEAAIAADQADGVEADRRCAISFKRRATTAAHYNACRRRNRRDWLPPSREIARNNGSSKRA